MSNWKDGPLPADTWNWGGVVLKGEDPANGFYFADFHGDHVTLCPDGRRVEASEVGSYNNSLDLPPAKTKSVRGTGTRLGLILVALLFGVSGVQAQFVVVNKTHPTPQFVVVNNKTNTSKTYDAYGMDYSTFHQHILRNGDGILVVGGVDRHIGTSQTHCHVASGFGGFSDGEYTCRLERGIPSMTKVNDVLGVTSPTVKSPPTKNGCGCEPSANCGAPFCKSRGGTGCPESCPVKKR